MNDPLITTEALAALIGAPGLKIIDGSWYLDGRDGRAGLREAHIPGAVFFDIDGISDHATPLPHMLPSPDEFAEAVGALGISERDRLVVYDQLGLVTAARVWWTFRVMGVDRVQVLDGGLPKWRSEGRPVESGEVAPRPARFASRFRPELVRDFKAVSLALQAGPEQIIDARAAARFRGEAPEPRAGLRSGHMPGARNLPFGEVLNPDATVKDPQALQAAFAAAGLDLDKPVTASCGSGITAAILALALARLGRWDASVYDGSWAEWGSRSDAEVATGPA